MAFDPVDLCCSECGLPEPIDDALHDGQLLCLTCAESCTCGQEVRVDPASRLIVPTPRGKWEISATETEEGWVVDEWLPEIKLAPGDLLEVDAGVVTGVRRTNEDFIVEVTIHPFVKHELAAMIAEGWQHQGFKVGIITPLDFCVASESLHDLYDVEHHKDVYTCDLIRVANEIPNITELVRRAFPNAPRNGD